MMLGLGFTFAAHGLQRAQSVGFDFQTGQMPANTGFTRGSAATYWGQNGDLLTAASGSPRFSFHPVDMSVRGVLIETQATNLMPYSAASAAHWVADASTASDLALSALGMFAGVDVVAAQPYALTIFYRAGTSGQGRLVFSGLAGGETHFSGLAGAMSVTRADIGPITNASETMLADGVTYRINLVYTPTSSGSVSVGLGPQSNVPGETIIVLGAQITAGIKVSSLIQTNGAVATRAADLPSITGLNGVFDVTIAYADATNEVLPGQVVMPGYWPVTSQTEIARIALAPV